MTRLELSIVEQANHELSNLRRALLMPEGEERVSAVSSSFWMLNGYTLLANLKDSGLSGKAKAELDAIDSEAGQAIATARLVGMLKR